MRIIGNDPSVPRQEHAVASGTLANGKPVVINADGTVSVPEGTVIGSETQFIATMGNELSAGVYDPDSSKVILAYSDSDNSTRGTAVVGTVSGTSISFGSPAVYNSGTTNHIGITYDTTNNKVVIVYDDAGNSGYGTAVVGTVSGTSISFGSEVVYNTASSHNNNAAFDTNTGDRKSVV